MKREREMTGLQLQSSQRGAVIVAVNANRTTGSVEAVEWALKYVVKPGDVFLILGVFTDHPAKKNSCFPVKLLMGLAVSGIYEALEFVDHEEVDSVELEEEFERKREEYWSILQPLYRQCSKNEIRYDESHFGDVYDYGKFLLELITGKCVRPVHDQGKDPMIEWALPLLENGELGKLMDCRLKETAGDARMVRHMSHAALRCLKVDSDRKLTIKESHNLNTRWIVLDGYAIGVSIVPRHFKKWKVFLRGHVTCNVAVVKEKDFASLMLSNDTQLAEICPSKPNYDSADPEEHLGEENSKDFNACELRYKSAPAPYPQNPCCYPLSWRNGFPRVFSYNELEVITNGFADDNILAVVNCITVHQGILQETPVLVKSFRTTNKGFWSVLEILSRVCHRNILNLVGYCSTGTSAFMLFDLPCMGTVGINLQWDELAEKLDWRMRWSIALEIGGSLRYLHEECVDGPIVHKNVRASSVALSHGYSAMLCNFAYAEWLKGDIPPTKDLISKYDKLHFGDVHDYGKFLLELITGKCVSPVHDQGKDPSMIERALPLLENGEFGKLKDCRLREIAGDARMVRNMAHAALRCLKVDSDHKLTISEAVAIVRGDELAIFNHGKLK